MIRFERKHRSRASWLYGLLWLCPWSGCADRDPPLSTANYLLEDVEPLGSWTTAEIIPAYQHPVLASFEDRVVLLAESNTRDWLTSYYGNTLDMWEWDGSAWTARSAAHTPSGRLLPGLTRLENKLVMFGGFTLPDDSYRPLNFLDETWEWNGTDWTQISPLKSPPGRFQVPLVSWQDKVLMFGGQAQGAAADTWTWNARDWIQQKPAHAPEYCNSPAAAIGGKVLMFCAARDAEDHRGHTWEWDGTDWRELYPETVPSNRYLHTLASFGDRVVMYGGYADSGNAQETWLWDGQNWTDVSVQPSPPMRDGYQTAQLGTDLILYGGGTNETWAWNGTSWRKVAPQAMPTARSNYALSAVGDKVILFGGCCKTSSGGKREYWDDTWQWDGARWTQLTPAHSPSGRAFTAFAAIDARSALLFGGLGAGGVLGDTWQWDADNHSWIERTSAQSPPARQRHALAELGGKLLMFGGASALSADAANALADTWQWDADTWTRLSPSASPPQSYDVALARFESTLLLFAGEYERSWIWNGSTWSQLNLEPSGPPALGPAYAVTLSTALGERLIALTNSPWSITAMAWDGAGWTWFPLPPLSDDRGTAQPLAAMSGTLLMLGSTPQRTFVFRSQ